MYRKTLIASLGALIVLLGFAVPAQAAEKTTNVVVYNKEITIVAEGVPLSKVAAVKKAAPADLAKITTGSVSTMGAITHCGWATCSVYLTRAQTRSMHISIDAYGGGIRGLTAACGLLALFTGPAAIVSAVACGVLITVYGGFLLSAINRAAADGGCLRIRYPVWAFYDDHSGYCRP